MLDYNYVIKEWLSNQVVMADDLNNIEDGIAKAHQKCGELNTNKIDDLVIEGNKLLVKKNGQTTKIITLPEGTGGSTVDPEQVFTEQLEEGY